MSRKTKKETILENTTIVEAEVITTGKAKRRPRVAAADFVTAWQGSESIAQVAEVTGLSAACCSSKASQFRKKYDIPLKQMPRGCGCGGGLKLDLEGLRNLCNTGG